MVTLISEQVPISHSIILFKPWEIFGRLEPKYRLKYTCVIFSENRFLTKIDY